MREPFRSERWPAAILRTIPTICDAASTRAAACADMPLSSLRKRTVKLIVADCARTNSAPPPEIDHSAGRRSVLPRGGIGVSGAGSRFPEGLRRRVAPASAAAPQAAPSSAYVQPSPCEAASGGSAMAAKRPPIGTLACRIPSASPRSDGSNQCMTARPLAALALATSAPTTASRTTSCSNVSTTPTPASATVATASPSGSTSRSPARSVRRPQGRSAGVMPIAGAARTTPIWASVSPKSTRSCGASTATLNSTAATVACAAVPTARTTHR